MLWKADGLAALKAYAAPSASSASRMRLGTSQVHGKRKTVEVKSADNTFAKVEARKKS